MQEQIFLAEDPEEAKKAPRGALIKQPSDLPDHLKREVKSEDDPQEADGCSDGGLVSKQAEVRNNIQKENKSKNTSLHCRFYHGKNIFCFSHPHSPKQIKFLSTKEKDQKTATKIEKKRKKEAKAAEEKPVAKCKAKAKSKRSQPAASSKASKDEQLAGAKKPRGRPKKVVTPVEDAQESPAKPASKKRRVSVGKALVTPEKNTERKWKPSPLAVKTVKKVDAAMADVRSEKARAALSELLPAMKVGDDFEYGFAAPPKDFAKKFLDCTCIMYDLYR